ncbi:MAG: helix-turn-helix transcriptional regulator [Proteobacteria bacterium]|nr:helix-turn-helix transcriptional regulator [Pseudomonadota bacterium]
MPAVRPLPEAPGRDARVAGSARVPPRVLAELATRGALVQVLEWHWPDLTDRTVVEHELMLELSLPPYAGTASASFPTIAPGTECGIGTLFLRYPGIAIRTRAEAGTFRLLRVTFSPVRQQALLGDRHAPSLAMLQRLMNIRGEAIRTVMRQLLREANEGGPGSAQAGEALVSVLEVELVRLFGEDVEPKAGGRLAPWQFRRLRERLEAGGDRPGVTELAAICGISVRHLHRQFLNLTGVTISDYVEAHLVNRAKALLAGGNRSIREIAEACGFDHANSFSRTFRRATGMTPMRYRQRRAARAGCERAGQHDHDGPE